MLLLFLHFIFPILNFCLDFCLLTTHNYFFLFLGMVKNSRKWASALKSVYHLQKVLISVLANRKGKCRWALLEFLPFLFFPLHQVHTGNFWKVCKTCNIANTKHKTLCLFVKSSLKTTQRDNRCICAVESVHIPGQPCILYTEQDKNIFSCCPHLLCLQLKSLPGN